LKFISVIFIAISYILLPVAFSQVGESINSSSFKIARLKYAGGGDWYNDPTAEVNMMNFVRENSTINTAEPKFYSVDIASDEIYNYPFIVITGHGNINFSEQESLRLRDYLESGGFLLADDDYGMDESFRREMKKIFPQQDLKELPFNHEVYRSHFNFAHGLPKIHEHDGKPPQGFGLFDSNGRLCVFYIYESNITDGWADPREHNDPVEKREEAMRMGLNIIVYSMMN